MREGHSGVSGSTHALIEFGQATVGKQLMHLMNPLSQSVNSNRNAVLGIHSPRAHC